MNKDSNFHTFLVCTFWIRFGFVFCIVDYIIMGLAYFYFKLDISKCYYIAQIIPGMIFFIYIEYSMISSYNQRKKTYLFVRSLLKENKLPKYSLLSAMNSTLCEKHCLHSLEKEFNKKLV